MKKILTRTSDDSVIETVRRIEGKTGERIEKSILKEARLFLRKGVTTPRRKTNV